MEHVYQKDMGHSDWSEVFARQKQRADLISNWLSGLQLRPGDHVLDIGAGPGFVSLEVATYVGPTGLVIAVDRSSDALAYLEQLQEERGVPQIKRFVADAATVVLPGESVDAALVTMVLHHTDDPRAVLRNVAQLLSAGARVVVGEFHPDGPCTMGPPREERIAPEALQTWCELAGLKMLSYLRQTPEHYMLQLERV